MAALPDRHSDTRCGGHSWDTAGNRYGAGARCGDQVQRNVCRLFTQGRWLAYISNETGADEIYVVPFPHTGAGKWAISAGGGTEPLWSHRGNELFYRDASGDLVAVEVHTNPTFSLGRSVALFPAAGFSSLRFAPQYAVALDDRRFLMIRPLQTGAPDKLIVVENWFEELRAKSRK